MRTSIFISYSHDDKIWHDTLLKHLSPAVNRGHIPLPWSDRLIKPGEKWSEAIGNALRDTKLAVLLVSANFLASKYVMRDELPIICHDADAGELSILSVGVSYSGYKNEFCLASRQWTNDPIEPLNSLTQDKQDKLWTEIVEKIVNAY